MVVRYLIICSILWGCSKKEFPKSWESDPVFYFDGSIGSDTLKYQAGKEGKSMKIFSGIDSLGIHISNGLLGPKNCDEPCDESIQIQLYDPSEFTTYMERLFHMEKSDWELADGSSIIKSDTVDIYTFYPDFQSLSTGHLWDFQSGDTSSVVNPKRVFSKNGKINVCLNQNFSGNCNVNICNTLYFRNSKDCRVQFEYQLLGNNTVQFSSQNESVVWTFGDGQSAVGQTVNHTYNISDTIIRVCATQIGKCNEQFCRDINLGSPLNTICGSGFTYTIQDSIYSYETPALLSGKVVVNYIDKNKKKYTNFKLKRSPNADEWMQIKSVESYIENSNDSESYKISARANIWLFYVDNPNDSLLLQSENWVFALPK